MPFSEMLGMIDVMPCYACKGLGWRYKYGPFNSSTASGAGFFETETCPECEGRGWR